MSRKTRFRTAVLAAVVIAASVPTVRGGVVFFGEDINLTDDPTTPAPDDPMRLASKPNSDLARLQFITMLADPRTENFDSYAAGTTPAFLTFGGDTAALTGAIAASGELSVISVPVDTFNGVWPTSGDNLLFQTAPLFAGDSFNLVFTQPQIAVGFYGTDIGDGAARLSLTFHYADSTVATLNVPHSISPPNISGTVFFFGIVDAMRPFTQVTFTNTDPTRHPGAFAGDGFGYDDITIGSALVPEPSSLALVVIGIAGAACSRRRNAALTAT